MLISCMAIYLITLPGILHPCLLSPWLLRQQGYAIKTGLESAIRTRMNRFFNENMKIWTLLYKNFDLKVPEFAHRCSNKGGTFHSADLVWIALLAPESIQTLMNGPVDIVVNGVAVPICAQLWPSLEATSLALSGLGGKGYIFWRPWIPSDSHEWPHWHCQNGEAVPIYAQLLASLAVTSFSFPIKWIRPKVNYDFLSGRIHSPQCKIQWWRRYIILCSKQIFFWSK